MQQRLTGPNGLSVAKLSVFPGTNPQAPSEQVAAEINRALAQIEAGDFEVIDLETADRD